MRTIKRIAISLNTNKQIQIKELVCAYTREKRRWVRCFQSRDFQAKINCPRLIRDEMVKEKYKSSYGLQARHWKLALNDAAEMWDKYWQSLFVRIRSKIAHFQKFTETELHYAYWLLKGYFQFTCLIQGKTPKPPFANEQSSCHRVAKYIHRWIRQAKGKAPCVKREATVRFDANCYETFYHKERQYIKLMSLQPGKRIVLPLEGKSKIDGTITLVIKEDQIFVHTASELKKKKIAESIVKLNESPAADFARKSIEAVDFGYTEVMTDTEGVRYGIQFGQLLKTASDRLSEKMRKRHKLHALEKKKKQIHSPKAKTLRKYNLGKKKHIQCEQRAKSSLEKEINHGINQLLKLKKPSILITENLRHNFIFNKSKNINRRLSGWLKGKLQDRIAFKALAEGFRHEQVNPAYGSQSCPNCVFVDSKNRNNDRFQCLHCGYEDASDRVAALNYVHRYGDPEIGLYTPYNQVKTILMARFHRRLETGNMQGTNCFLDASPVTIPGRTLDTAIEVHPPPLSRHCNVTVGREKSRKHQAVTSESETK